MDKIEKTLGIKPATATKYAMYAGIFCVMFGFMDRYITSAIAVAYPTFQSFLALESDDDADDKQWLTYWVVFGVIQIIDIYAGFILTLIPFYFFLKMGFLLWLQHPATFGATWLYNNYINEAGLKLDAEFQKAQAEMAAKVDEAKQFAGEKAAELKGKMGKGN